MKKSLTALLALAFLMLGAGPVLAADHEILNLDLISAPFGTGSYVLSSALEDMSKKSHPWLRINATESPGLAFNTKKLNKEPELKKKMFMSYSMGIDWLATTGQKPFTQKYPSAKLLATYNMISIWLATLNPNIKKPEDLIGKKVALGRAPQIGWTIQPEWVITHGWGLRDKIEIQKVGTKPAMTALLDGLVDAAIIGGYANPLTGKLLPSPQTLELIASGKKLYHISWGEEAVKKAVASGLPITPTTLAANSMKTMDTPVSAWCEAVSWCAYPEFPEEAAYEVTKMIIENVSSFKDYHNLGNLMSRECLPYGWPREKIHPGALKAYQEAGLLK